MAKKLVISNNPLLSGPGLARREGMGSPYREIAVSAIDRDSNQPRVNFDPNSLNELADSIKRYGILSPVLVKPGKLPGRYNLIAGERRVRASKLVGLSTIPAIVDSKDEGGHERTLSIQLVENLQRADLTPLERAQAIGALQEANSLTVREVAERLGISKSTVQRSLDLLNLPPDLMNALRNGASESKILMLVRIEDEAIRAAYIKELDSVSRSQLQKSIQENQGKPKTSSRKERELSPEDRRIADEIQRALGLKVTMTRSGLDSEKGRLSIEFYSDGDLQELFRKLLASG